MCRYLQKMDGFCSKLVYILLSATFIDLDKHTSLQSNPLRIRNVYSVQAPDRLIQILHDR